MRVRDGGAPLVNEGLSIRVILHRCPGIEPREVITYYHDNKKDISTTYALICFLSIKLNTNTLNIIIIIIIIIITIVLLLF